MPTPLTFKGQPPTNMKKKKRKRAPSPSDPSIPTSTTSPPPPPAAPDGANPSSSSTSSDWTHPDRAHEALGPLLIVFPDTSPVTCLTCSLDDGVYAGAVENMVEGLPGSAEPSATRQVWVASRVGGGGTGTTMTTRGTKGDGGGGKEEQEEGGKVAGVGEEEEGGGGGGGGIIGLRGDQGKYLGADAEGRVSARREARGVEEGWEVVRGGGGGGGPGRWRLRDWKGRWLVAEREGNGKLVVRTREGGGGEGGAGTTTTRAGEVVVRMQKGFKPRLERERKERAYEKIGRAQIEKEAGRALDEDEVRRLKKARKKGTYHEEMLDVRAKGKHDKFA